MDKKIKHRILYVTVAILWGIALYRTWKNYETKAELDDHAQVQVPAVSPIRFQKDSFELELPERDPFLDQRMAVHVEMAQETNHTSQTKKPEEKKIVEVQQINWPDIHYYGFVKNRQTSSTRGLLKINGKHVQLSLGEIYQDIRILEAYHDSVRVSFARQIKVFRK